MVVLAAVVLAVLGPLYTIVLTSISSQATITSAGGLVLVPGESPSPPTSRSSAAEWSPGRSW